MRTPEIPGVAKSATKAIRRTRNLERRYLASGGGIPAFVDMGDPDVIVTSGSDPVVYGGPGRWQMSYRGYPGEVLTLGDAVLILMSVAIDSDPGASGPGVPDGVGGYEISCAPYVGWPGYEFIAGSGWTEIGGVPYAVFPKVSPTYTDRFVLKCPNVVDPSAGSFFNTVRPDWPGAYAPGDVIFYGEVLMKVAAP